MRTKVINGQYTVVCNNCGDQFKVGDKMRIQTDAVNVNTVELYSGYEAPFCTEVTMSDQNYFHDSCFTPQNSFISIDTIKEAINKLDQKQKQSIYEYLYYTFKIRI